MAVVKVVELMAESEKSWEDATQKVVDEASKTIDNIKGVYIKDFTVVVDDQKIKKYRVTAKLSFEVK